MTPCPLSDRLPDPLPADGTGAPVPSGCPAPARSRPSRRGRGASRPADRAGPAGRRIPAVGIGRTPVGV